MQDTCALALCHSATTRKFEEVHRQAPLVMYRETVEQLYGLIFLVFAASITGEYLYSKWQEKGWYRDTHLLSDLSLALLTLVTDFVFKALAFGGYYLVWQSLRVQKGLPVPELAAGWPLTLNEGAWQFHPAAALTWVLVFFAVDLCTYWNHRLSHEINLLWALHITHHSSETYNLGTALRQGILQESVNWLFYLPLAFIGVPWQMYALCYLVHFTWVFFVHTQLNFPLGRLERVLLTPSHHRVHHGRNPLYIDRNYGSGMFSLWDRLFGTFQAEVEPVRYGITHPLHALNAGTANLHYLGDLLRATLRCRSLGDAWRLLVGPPGWWPSYLPAPAPMPHGYLPQPSVSVVLYATAQFLLAAGVLLFAYQPDRLLWLGLPAAWTLLNVGLLLEGRRLAWVSEALRWVAVVGVGIWLWAG